MNRFFKKEKLSVRLVLAAAVLGLLALVAVFQIPCFFKTFFGVPCPVCGMGRAWRAALKLDFSAAFFYHPLFWVLPLLFILFVFFNRNKRFVLYVFGGTVLLFPVVFAVRMAMFYPDTAPMNRGDNAILFRFFKKR